MKKSHDYIHHYRGYWSEGGKCRIRIYREDGREPVVICSQLPDNENTSVTNMAEYLAAEVFREHKLPTPLTWIEHYPEHERAIGEYSLVRFSFMGGERGTHGRHEQGQDRHPCLVAFAQGESALCAGGLAKGLVRRHLEIWMRRRKGCRRGGRQEFGPQFIIRVGSA